MTDTGANIKKKLFVKLYSERDARSLVPGSAKASSLIDNLRRDEIHAIYIIAPNRSVAWPYMDLFQKEAPGIVIHDLLLEKIEQRHVGTIQSVIDDINASIRAGRGCEIIVFNENLAGVILACFYVHASKNPSRAIEQVKKIIPNLILTGSELSFINEYCGHMQEVRDASPGLHAARDAVPAGSAAVPASSDGAVLQRGRGDIREIDLIRRFLERTEPAGALARFGIATKLTVFVSLILIVSLGLMILLGTVLSAREARSQVESVNAVTARLAGERFLDEIAVLMEKARTAAENLSADRPSDERPVRMREMRSGDGGDFIFVGIAGRDGDDLAFKRALYNEEFLNRNHVSRGTIRVMHRNNAAYFMQSFDRKIIVRNVSPDAGMPVLGMSFPYRYRKGSVSSVVLCYVPLRRFMDTAAMTGPVRTFLVSDRGDCVVDRERNRVLARVDMSDVPIVKKMLLSTEKQGSMRYRDRDGRYHLGSYNKLDAFGLGVIIAAAEDTALRGVRDVRRRNFIILAIILIAAVLGAFVFSKSISAPIDSLRQLAAAAPSGFPELNAPGKGDEIAYLMQLFRSMLRSNLEARERPEGDRPAKTRPAGVTAGSGGVPASEPPRDAVTQQFGTEGLRIQVTYDGPEVSMVWMGQGNLKNPGELLNPYLEGLINSLRGRDLTCDFSSLETMNAPLIQSIIKFAYLVDESRVRARFVYNKSIDWQDASFEALGAVVQDMNTISLDGRVLEKNMFILQ